MHEQGDFILTDRESLKSDVIALVIRALDNGGQYSDVTMQVHVTDENDNPPRFRKEVETARVKEDATPGSFKLNQWPSCRQGLVRVSLHYAGPRTKVAKYSTQVK